MSSYSKRISLWSKNDGYSSNISHTRRMPRLRFVNAKSIIENSRLLGRVGKSVLLLPKRSYVLISSSKGLEFCFWQQYKVQLGLSAFMSSIIKTWLWITCLQLISFIVLYTLLYSPSQSYLWLTLLSYRLTILVFLRFFPDCGSNFLISKQRQ